MVVAADTDPAWQSGDELESEVARHVRERDSGTLFVRTADNHWGCFVFSEGSIVSLMCRGVRGTKSLVHLRKIAQCTYRFDAGALLGEDVVDLPSTEEILEQLGGGDIETLRRPIGLSAAELKRTVSTAAVAILGPMGALVCDEQFARAGMLAGMEDVEQLLRAIGHEIDDPDEAKAFRDEVIAAATPRGGSTSGQRAAVTEGSAEYNKIRNVLEAEAAEFLGPMGPVLCEEYFLKYAVDNNIFDIGSIINALADEIDDVRLSDQFRNRIAERLEPQ
ncbi:MAG: hypothetical protein OET44_13450 [Gammaproteobacteria bacterium]|nr:hypothetical protein [Gammaproteobacteria bacterium]